MTTPQQRSHIMTNPFAIITFHAVNAYHKVLTEQQQTTLPKLLIYTAGTTLLATAIYKTIKRTTTPTSTSTSTSTIQQRPYNFLYTLSLPFKYLLYKFQCRKSITATTTNAPSSPPFEDKYFNEYDEWVKTTHAHETTDEHKKECLENMYYSTVRETINEFYGDVIMCYDHATLSFAYYARTGNIPYKYLETISRKYMIETNAPKEIHVDIRTEYNKAKDAAVAPPLAPTAPAPALTPTTSSEHDADSDHDHDHDHDPDPETAVFVKLKSYNKATNLKIHTHETTEKKGKIVSPDQKKDPTNVILRENANRYSYRGKIEDFTENHKTFLAQRRKATATSSSLSSDSNTKTSSSSSSSSTKDTPEVTTGYAEFKKQIQMKTAL